MPVSADKEHTEGAGLDTVSYHTHSVVVWFDKTHVCRTEHYRNFLFRRAYFLRDGDFIEDTFGHRELGDIKANGLGAHAKYGTFLYERDDELELLAHMDGRRFLTPTSVRVGACHAMGDDCMSQGRWGVSRRRSRRGEDRTDDWLAACGLHRRSRTALCVTSHTAVR